MKARTLLASLAVIIAACSAKSSGTGGDSGAPRCTSSESCGQAETCDLATHTCVLGCAVSAPCASGCCSATSRGSCMPGTSDDACGSSGVCTACSCSAGACVSSGLKTLSFTGDMQTFVVPAGVTSVTVTAVGADGGSCGQNANGHGGVTTATLAVTPGETLTVLVGGSGACSVSVEGGVANLVRGTLGPDDGAWFAQKSS